MDDGLVAASRRNRRRPRAGPYEIVGTLGEGGMGVVYRGRQTAPIKRDVAIKMLHAGLNTERILERFAWERRSLARMDHPNIARILDAGVDAAAALRRSRADRGRAHHHLVPGARPRPRPRLRLVERVCQAVQHAHDRGVLHRDLKPGNILVATSTGPRARDHRLRDRQGAVEPTPGTDRQLTLPGHAIGTPAYMSPEQIAGAARPRRAHRRLRPRRDPLRAAGRTAALHRRAAGPEPRPGRTRRPPSRTGERRQLRGDLDWICLRAVHPDPDRRYRSAAELAEDLRRYRERRPVLARPTAGPTAPEVAAPSPGARPPSVVAVVAFALAGAAFLGYHVQRLEAERTRALAAEAHAHREAVAAAEIAAFLEGLFVGHGSHRGGAAPTSALGLLDQGADRLEEGLAVPARRTRPPVGRARVG